MRYSCIMLIMLLATTAQAQTDSTRTEYKTEDESISKSDVRRFIRYITRANVEEKTLIKVGVWPASNNTVKSYKPLLSVGFNAETTIERKLNAALSVYAGVNYSFLYNRYERVLLNAPINGPTESFERQQNFTLIPKAGVRYY